MLEDVVAALPVFSHDPCNWPGKLRDACGCMDGSTGQSNPNPSRKRRLQIKLTNLEKKPGDSSVDKSLVLTVEELLRQSKYIHRTSNLESDLRIMVSGRFSPRQNQVI
jgi:hypothetical protein